LPRIPQAEQAQEAAVHSASGFVDGHPAGFHFFLGGPAEGKAGRQQPAWGDGGVQITAFLSALDQVEQTADDRRVAAGILLRSDRGQVPRDGVSGGRLPSRLQKPDQRDRRRQVVEPGGVEGRGDLGGGSLDDGVEQRLAGGEVGVDGLPCDAGGAGDVLDAGTGVGVQGLGRGLQDRGDALAGVRPLPSPPGLRLR
jgi:hypothetical protein